MSTEPTESPEDIEARHKAKMQKHKAAVDQRIAKADTDTGVLLVMTGPGKGKSSSGFGMVARALGHGMRVGVVQFIKGAIATGEERFYRRFPEEVAYHVTGEGFTWETQNRARDVERAEAGWQLARGLLRDPAVGLVLLDELNIVLSHDYLDTATVLDDIAARPSGQHVVVTGRGAPQALIELANTVSEVKVVKHAFKQGIRAQPGLEF
ncbi:MAG TPA: cob(I)yrinic acid a,c-diamide adenosyltransferase [Ideonella sp.]|uniref:cob(I)yrinic acid a,c-diamide adenosyltransferase n=1 Tax=Ideonella sp. TaxID=1929293 RepID=UPI002C12FA54|nr:cob(I)yrinic acid a,c-diamide adenosyltransferase [Ideonella sp.]HSI51413.1 cob(I)yrinic acid a,c-diamide adenosyltransferase [Ideonella sp.]